MAKLYVLSGPDVGRSYEVGPGAVIGRAAECPVHLRDASVSRQHARIEEHQGEWAVADLESRNGLRVRGARVRRAVLADGDEFALGEVLLRFRSDAGGELGDAGVLAGSAPARGLAFERVEEPVAEIELEGDWSNVTHVPSVPVRASPAEPVARPTSAGPAQAPAAAGAPSRLRAAAALAASQRGAGAAQRGILQYQREPDRQGFFSADLAQQPLWVRFAVWVAVIALFIVLFWLAFRGTAFLKGKAQG